MGIIAWIIVGLIAGLIAKALMPGEEPGGIILTVILGIAGAFVGGSWLSRSELVMASTTSTSAPSSSGTSCQVGFRVMRSGDRRPAARGSRR